MSSTPSTHAVFDRYIDRFLLADGWRVTAVDSVTTPGKVAVTLSLTTADGSQSVTRTAAGGGEATFLACSSARRLARAEHDDDES